MRTSSDLNLRSALFIDDVENGGTLIQFDCPCKTEMVSMYNDDEPVMCLVCNTEIVYRPWFEW
jgi:hypothetical protein